MAVSVIDVPGHWRLVHTMIAGAAGIELVLLVVAADEGVMPQTREHVAACELLGLRRAVVAITKVDRAGRSCRSSRRRRCWGCSARGGRRRACLCRRARGAGLEELRAAVKRALVEIEAAGKERGGRRGSRWTARFR
ncbi:MAG: GTP-binding protein [Polyangiaceae bacterium]